VKDWFEFGRTADESIALEVRLTIDNLAGCLSADDLRPAYSGRGRKPRPRAEIIMAWVQYQAMRIRHPQDALKRMPAVPVNGRHWSRSNWNDTIKLAEDIIASDPELQQATAALRRKADEEMAGRRAFDPNLLKYVKARIRDRRRRNK
jgi:hypothetical protein